MPLTSSVRHAVAIKLEEYEGRYSHLYLDTVGKVTVGIGHMIPDRHSIAVVPMYTIQNGIPSAPATTAQKQHEFDQISKQKRNYRAGWYKQYCTLMMKNNDIDTQRDRHINSFYSELSLIYNTSNGFTTGFDRMPTEAQLALFDMIFNLGATKLNKQFINFNKAIQNENWLTASRQCHRPQVSAVRNDYVMKLFQSAHNKAISAKP